ncbi:MAG TPA: hypothetical protein VM056_02445 [Terriglobales bacterium]|nr:hypothetical protein [Terriglobales bacterium]
MFDSFSPASPAGRPRLAVLALAIALAVTAGYAVQKGHSLNQMEGRTTQLQSSLAETQQQLQQVSAKLTEMQTPPPQPEAAQVNTPRKASGTRVAPSRLRKMQRTLDEHGRAIQSTREELATTRGEVARTSGQIAVLQRKGERNYFEFDIEKSKQFQANGPVGIRLKKANVKNQFADLELMVDDRKLTKKHVNLYEPTLFYAEESDHPVEIVINSVTKNHIRGYVSTPKYRRSQLAAMSPSEGTLADGSVRPVKERVRMMVQK